MLYEIKDIAGYYKEENKPMLGQFPAAFWNTYRANFQHFDRLFMKRFRSWFPMDQEGDLEEVSKDFTFDVTAWLLLNEKRYSELYRIENIPDNDAYSLTNNVDYTETTQRDVTFDKGAQENTVDAETVFGRQTVEQDNSTTYGALSGTNTKEVSAYNSSSYEPSEQNSTSQLSHEDTEDNETTYGAHTDTRDDTYTDGARQDVTDEDVTVHKVGNMGVQTVDDMLGKHWDNWEHFTFYTMIFDEIARELLRGVR